jgi:hypothetical protein
MVGAATADPGPPLTDAFTDPDRLAEDIVRRVGPKIVLGLPLGLGKANHVANALYRRAEADPGVDLTIFTALTLEPPRPASDLERRFLGPLIARTMGGYPPLLYGQAAREGRLPANVRVEEFFFQAGSRLHSPAAQRDYISVNYTHAVTRLLERGLNVVAQLTAARGAGAERRFSLSCNSDTTLDLLAARASGAADFLLVAEVNDELPFMGGDADLPASAFAMVLDGCGFPLFAPPKEPIEAAHYAIGFHVASLVPDGGTLQLGIGSTADAICQALIVRHQAPALFKAIIERLAPGGGGIARHVTPFEQGLYASTEMFVDGFLQLHRAGVLTRSVDGAVLHGGFFIGPRDFYRALREMPDAERARFAMTSVQFTNALYGDEAAKRAARPHARFANNAMAATLLGEVCSDTLEDGRVVSGVGGQYDFVAQAFALGRDARSIITLNATRQEGFRQVSNVRWACGRITVPRHLRDIIVTEYGVADLRGKSDAETIAAMLAVSDARFAPGLETQAKAAGKLAPDYRRPEALAANTAEALKARLAPATRAGLAPPFPFGSDFTPEELGWLPTLGRLREAQASPRRLARLLLKGLASPKTAASQPLLERLGLARPRGPKAWIMARLVRGAQAAPNEPDAP